MEMTEKMSIGRKMMHTQVELDAPKSQYNKFGGFPYRNAEDIKQALKPLQAKYGFYMEYEVFVEVIENVRYVKVVAIFADCDSDSKISSNGYAKEPVSKKGMSEEQVTGSATSYATKYALSNLFSIDDAEDADNLPNGGYDKSNTKPKQSQPKPSTPNSNQQVITSEELAKVMKGIEALSKASGQELREVIITVQNLASVSELKNMPKNMLNDCLSWLGAEINKYNNNQEMSLENM